MPSDRDAADRRRPAGHSHRLRLNRRTRGMSLSAPIDMQPLVMKSSLLAAVCDLELGTPTVARLGQPTEVAGEWRPPYARHYPAHRLDAVDAEGRSRCVRRRRGAREGLPPLSARGVGHAPAAAQPSRKSQPSSPGANPVQEVAGTVVWHGWVPLGPTERPPGARQTCFWALFQRSRANPSWDGPPGSVNTVGKGPAGAIGFTFSVAP